jgi:predicted PurR-regulated permease PerM
MIRLELSTRGLILAVVALVVFWLLLRIWPILLIVVISLMLATALLPFIDWMTDKGLNRGLAVVVLVILLLLIVGLVGFLLTPAVIQQTQTLADRLPVVQARAGYFLDRHHLTTLANEVRRFNPADLLESHILAQAGSQVIAVVTVTVTVLALTAYILLDARRISRFVFLLIPSAYHETVKYLLAELRQMVGGYIRGQLLRSLIIAGYTFLVVEILGVPDALALAVIAAIADVLPVVGPLLSVVPAALAALSVSLIKALFVVGLLTVYQMFEGQVLIPWVYGATLQLPAVVVFVALLVGADLQGFTGALLSLPAAAALRVFFDYGQARRSGQRPELDHATDDQLPPDGRAESVDITARENRGEPG